LDLYLANDAELEKYLQQHAEKFLRDPRFSFEKIYLRTDATPEQLEKKLAAVQAQLAAEGNAEGDQSLLPLFYEDTTAFIIDRAFGDGFARQLQQLELNTWSQPMLSGLGLHIVKVSHYQPPRLPTLAEVRPQVEREWQNDRNTQVKTAMLDGLRAQYDIVIEWPAQSNNSNGS